VKEREAGQVGDGAGWSSHAMQSEFNLKKSHFGEFRVSNRGSQVQQESRAENVLETRRNMTLLEGEIRSE
jgi:hypothetical protein